MIASGYICVSWIASSSFGTNTIFVFALQSIKPAYRPQAIIVSNVFSGLS